MTGALTRIMVYDSTQGALSTAWRAGAALGGFDHIVAARSVYELVRGVSDAMPATGPVHVQFWGHGRPGAACVQGGAVFPSDWLEAIGKRAGSVLWLRACDVFQGERGQQHAVSLVGALGFGCVGHTRTVSAPWPTHQSGGYGLRPGETPQWSVDEAGGSNPFAPHTCLLTRMTVPASWWQ